MFMADTANKKKPLGHQVPVGVLDDFNRAVTETRCSHQDATEAAVKLWVSLSNEQRALLNVRIASGKPVDLAEVASDEPADVVSDETYFLRAIDRYSETIKAFSKTDQAGVKRLIATLEAESADVSPAAHLVDNAVAASKVRKRKTHRTPLESA